MRAFRLAVALVAATVAASGGAAATPTPSRPLLTFGVSPFIQPSGFYGLCATDLHGHTFRLTDPLSANRYPTWSPNGREIAFVRDRIVIADAQGRIRRRLGRFSPDYFGYSGLAWSPDGRTLAATHYARALSTGLMVLNVDGTGSRMLVDEQGSPIGNPSWSPDGRRILFSRGSEGVSATWVIELNGANKRKFLDSASDAVWSPDGQQLAYVAHDGARVAGLAVARADGSDARLLTQGIVDGPAWSPDGRTIAFTRITSASLPLRIALIKPDGTGERTVATRNLAGARASDVTWRRPAPLPANRRPCVTNGTARADVIRGTNRGDVIVGGAGDDTIYGAGGADLLVGSGGRDRLHGGRGNDFFRAKDRARDVVFGGAGSDVGEFDSRLDRLTSIERRR